MSRFTKNRKIARLEKAKRQHEWDEMSRKQNKSFENMLKVAEIIDKEYPEYESFNEEKRLKIFGEIFKKVQNDIKH